MSLQTETQSIKNKERTNSGNCWTLIVNVFGADVTHHLRSYSLKTDIKGHLKPDSWENDTLANSLE